MSATETIPIGATALGGYVGALLARTGFSEADAAEVAGALVEADLRGLASHGVMHVPNLIKRTRLGLVNPSARIRTIVESASVARLDADRGAGFIVAARAMDLAVSKAGQTGAGVVTVTNSTHYGMGARYAERAARAGMIGIALANATPTMPAPGGAQAVVGTNPISLAVPGSGDDPAFCLDMGLGQVTLGSVRDALKRGAQLPDGVAAGPDGKPTRDPAVMLNGGFLLPAGAHKGFALAVAVEMLAGVLAGAGVGDEVGSLFVDYDRPQRTGHFLLALDPGQLLGGDQFDERRDVLIAWIRGAARAEGAGPALLPGEREQATKRSRAAGGIPLQADVAADLARLGVELSVDAPDALVGAPEA